MDKSLIEKYKKEMLEMYRSSKSTVIPMQSNSVNMNGSTIPIPAERPQADMMPPTQSAEETGTGSIRAVVTTLRRIYPVVGAKVTIFTGNYDDMQVIMTGMTDESGKTQSFVLPAPDRYLSESPDLSDKPYSAYNMLVQADGYIDNIHLNIPVFSGVESVQQSNLMLFETAGENKGPQIFDEGQQFNL